MGVKVRFIVDWSSYNKDETDIFDAEISEWLVNKKVAKYIEELEDKYFDMAPRDKMIKKSRRKDVYKLE